MAKMETLLYNIYLTNVKEIESASEYQIKDRERKKLEESDSEPDESDSSSDEESPAWLM